MPTKTKSKMTPKIASKIKKISLEEAYISPYFDKYCVNDQLLEYNINYDYLLDKQNLRFKKADENNVTFIISATVPGSQNLKNINDAPLFCQLTNDYFQDKVNSYNKANKTKHSFFAVLPFNNPIDCLKELERVNKFNPPINRVLFNGPTVNNSNYDWLEDSKWEILWKYANANKTVFYCHPFIAKSLNNKLPDNSMIKYIKDYPQIISSQFGFHINAGIFYLKLYINKIFDNYPNIQWIAGHMGETLLWFLWRFDNRTRIYRNEVNNIKRLYRDNTYTFMDFPKKTLTDIFTTQKGKKHAQIVCTTSGWFNTPALKFALEVAGVENILFSIDTPYENFDSALKWFNNLKLSKHQLQKIGWKNANDILKIF